MRRCIDRRRRRRPATALLALLAGCTVGPTPQRPATLATETAAFAGSTDKELPELHQWWKRFGDATTDELVTAALEGNTDLRAAAARVLAASASLDAARGDRLPAIDASLHADRSRRTFAFGGDRFAANTTTLSGRVDVQWRADLFGKLRRAEQADWYRLLATRADRLALLHSVVAEVVRARVAVSTLQQRVQIANQRIAAFREIADLIATRQQHGLASALEASAAQENLQESVAALPELQRALAEAGHGLNVLLGRAPGEGADLPTSLPTVPPLPPPPTGVPAALLDRRPDLQASELRAMARQADVGVAVADLYPDLTLGAGLGIEGSNLSEVVDLKNRVWSLVGGLIAPVWHGGKLRAEVRRARAEAEAAAADYAGDVLSAMREVEDALVFERTAWQRQQALADRVAAAKESERLVRQRYQQDLVSLLDVLEVERRRYDAEDALAQNQRGLWQARVALVLALGGDWTDEDEGKHEHDDAEHATH